MDEVLDLRNEIDKLTLAQISISLILQVDRTQNAATKYFSEHTSGLEPTFHLSGLSGDIYLLLLASNRLARIFHKNLSLSPFILSQSELTSIHNLRNIWEHQGPFEAGGETIMSDLHDNSKKWINEKFGGNAGRVFTLSFHEYSLTIADSVTINKIREEAVEWKNLVFGD